MFVSSFAVGGIAELRPDGRTREVVPQGLVGPFGVTVDLGGTVHAADHYRLVSPDGPDGGVTTRELLTFAHGIAADRGLLHVTSQYGDVRTYDPETRTARVRASGLDQPTGIAVLAGGSLVVAEAGAGRVLVVGADDAVTVLAAGLGHPVGVAVDAEQRCYASDDRRGTVVRIADGAPVVVAEGLDGPQGLAVRGGDLLVVETGRRRLVAIDLTTGDLQVEAGNLAVDPPPRVEPALFAGGMPGVPRWFAGVAVGPDGSACVSATAEGSVLHLSPPAEAR